MKFHEKDIVIYEKNGIKQGLIFSSDEENSKLDTVIIVPILTILQNNTSSNIIKIPKRATLENDINILIDEVEIVSKNQIHKKIAQLTNEEFDLVISYL